MSNCGLSQLLQEPTHTLYLLPSCINLILGSQANLVKKLEFIPRSIQIAIIR